MKNQKKKEKRKPLPTKNANKLVYINIYDLHGEKLMKLWNQSQYKM